MGGGLAPGEAFNPCHGREQTMSQPLTEAAVAEAVRSLLCQRRPLPAGDVLFVETQEARAELACLAEQATETEDHRQAPSSTPLDCFQEFRHWCGQCRALLPSAHLLDLHLSEVHDSFFAAQAARGLRVYVCLVEGCPHRSASVAERQAHLLEQHGISDALDLNTAHLRRRKPKTKSSKAAGRKAQHRPSGDAATSEAPMDIDGA